MIVQPVTSSNIKAIGFDAGLQILAVYFISGKAYGYGPVTREDFDAFMAAESKGSYFAKHFKSRPFIPLAALDRVDTPAAPSPEAGTAIHLQEPEPLRPLETFHNDDCCSKLLQRSDRTGLTQWECPKCGHQWNLRVAGPLRHWEPAADFFLLRTVR